MTRRVPCPPAPGLLEGYAAQFADLCASVAQLRVGLARLRWSPVKLVL